MAALLGRPYSSVALNYSHYELRLLLQGVGLLLMFHYIAGAFLASSVCPVFSASLVDGSATLPYVIIDLRCKTVLLSIRYRTPSGGQRKAFTLMLDILVKQTPNY